MIYDINDYERMRSDDTMMKEQGCFHDDPSSPDMPNEFQNNQMTSQWCVVTCKQNDYQFAGLQVKITYCTKMDIGLSQTYNLIE